MSEDRPSEDQAQPKKKVSIVRIILMLLVIFGFLIFYYNQGTKEGHTEHELNMVYRACQDYWAKNGSDKDCNVKALSNPDSHYFPKPWVTIEYSGNKENFTGTAQHRNDNRVYTIDAKGRTKRK
ncbi:MAG: hypothetical protein IH886_02575 [Nitrospinae bacterium]|nr:hypothetical protein [Nitrospinota bacterium]